jgi:hypothetical protein
MSLKIQESKILFKRTDIPGVVPTLGPSNDHTDGTWTNTDIYPGELFINISDNLVYIGANDSVIQLPFSLEGNYLSLSGGTFNNNTEVKGAGGIHTYWGGERGQYFSLTTDNDDWNECGLWTDSENFEIFADGYKKFIALSNVYDNSGLVIQNDVDFNEGPENNTNAGIGLSINNRAGDLKIQSQRIVLKSYTSPLLQLYFEGLPTFDDNNEALNLIGTNSIYKTSGGDLKIAAESSGEPYNVVQRKTITLTGSELFDLAGANEGYGVLIHQAELDEFVEIVNSPIMLDNGIPFFDPTDELAMSNTVFYIYHGEGGQSYTWNDNEFPNIFQSPNNRVKVYQPEPVLRISDAIYGESVYWYATIPSNQPINTTINPNAKFVLQVDYIVRKITI